MSEKRSKSLRMRLFARIGYLCVPGVFTSPRRRISDGPERQVFDRPGCCVHARCASGTSDRFQSRAIACISMTRNAIEGGGFRTGHEAGMEVLTISQKAEGDESWQAALTACSQQPLSKYCRI